MMLIPGKAARQCESITRPMSTSPELDALALRRAGMTHHAQGEFSEAVGAFIALSCLSPLDADACAAHGASLAHLGRYAEALVELDAALRVNPRHADAILNRVRVMGAVGQTHEGLQYLELHEIESSPELLALRGILYSRLDRWDEACITYAEVLAIEPDNDLVRCQWARTLHMLGRHEEGWTAAEARRRLPTFIPFEPAPGATSWLGGTSLDGKTLLVHEEQGHGDMIMCLRYLPAVIRSAARVVVALPHNLKQLVQTNFPEAIVISAGDPVPAYDCYCPIMSLPLAVGIKGNEPEVKEPYLRADLARMTTWREHLSNYPRPWVGVNWAGSSRHPRTLERDLPVRELRDLVDLPMTMVSLQYTLGAEDHDFLLQHPACINLGNALGDFLDAASLVAVLDHVLTVDTAYAHLAGAVGTSTTLLLGTHQEARWGSDGASTPWYPRMRILRRRQHPDWATTVRAWRNAVVEDLIAAR